MGVELGIIPAFLIFSFVVSFAFSVLYVFRSSDDDYDQHAVTRVS